MGERPSLLMIHGAANGAWVWDSWRRELAWLGWQANVMDLRGHGLSLPVDFSEVMMEDYLADIESVTPQITKALGAHPVIVGWSMGGLLALMYASKHPETPALLLFSPSPPFEVAGRAPIEELRRIPAGAVGPEFFGIFPDDFARTQASLSDLAAEEVIVVMEKMATTQESGFATRQRDRGIPVAASDVRCPVLVVYGEDDRGRPPEINEKTAAYLGGESICVEGAGHWGVVFSESKVRETAPRVAEWLSRAVGEQA